MPRLAVQEAAHAEPGCGPSERGREALSELQGLLEDKKKPVAARAEEKTAQNVAARASTTEKFRAKCEEGLKGYEGRYADLGVPCARKPHGPFQTLRHDFPGGPSALVAAVDAVDADVEKLDGG